MLFRTLTILAFAAAVSAVPIAGSGGDYPVFDPSLSTSTPTTLPTDFASAPVAPLTATMGGAETVSPDLDSTGSTSTSDFPDVSMFDSPTPTTSPTNVEPVTGGLSGAPQGTENATEDDLNQLFDKMTAPPAGGNKVPPTVEPPCGSTTLPTPVLPSPTSVPTAGVPTPEQAIEEEPTSLPPLGDFNLPGLEEPTPSPVLPTGEANAAPTPCATPTGVPTSPVGLLPPGKCNTSADCKGAGECCSEFGNCGTSQEYCSRSRMGIPTANAVASPPVVIPSPSPSPSPCPSPTPAPTPAFPVDPSFQDVTGNEPPLPAFPTPSVSVPPIGFAEREPPTSNPPTPTPPCSCANNPTSPGTTLSNPPIPVSPATETPNPITSFPSSPFSGLPDAPTPTGSPANEDFFGTNTPVLPAVTPGSPTPTATTTPPTHGPDCDKNNLPAELNATTPASIDDLTGNSSGAMVAALGGAGLTGSSMGSSGGKAMTYKPAY